MNRIDANTLKDLVDDYSNIKFAIKRNDRLYPAQIFVKSNRMIMIDGRFYEKEKTDEFYIVSDAEYLKIMKAQVKSKPIKSFICYFANKITKVTEMVEYKTKSIEDAVNSFISDHDEKLFKLIRVL